MDDRQTQIREGAGLEDSRINQDFLDFLNKWSSPFLMTLAVAALIYAGMQYMDRKRVARVDQAFSELSAATAGGNPAPASLKTLAAEYKGVRSVPELALLTTADLYLNASVVGYQPGATIDQLTGLPPESDMLDDTQRQAYLDQAGDLAQQVLDMAKGVKGKELLAMQALTRLASVKEGKRDFEGAKGLYQQLSSLATDTHFVAVASFADRRIERLDALKDVAPLPGGDELAALPGEDLPPAMTPEELQDMMNSLPSMGNDGEENAEDPDTLDLDGTTPESASDAPTSGAPAEESPSP